MRNTLLEYKGIVIDAAKVSFVGNITSSENYIGFDIAIDGAYTVISNHSFPGNENIYFKEVVEFRNLLIEKMGIRKGPPPKRTSKPIPERRHLDE